MHTDYINLLNIQFNNPTRPYHDFNIIFIISFNCQCKFDTDSDAYGQQLSTTSHTLSKPNVGETM